jgi:hypothetical protein
MAISQRNMMRDLFKRYGGVEDSVIKAYAAAERRGEVERKNNRSGYGAEQYARALWADGLKNGWLPNHTVVVDKHPYQVPSSFTHSRLTLTRNRIKKHSNFWRENSAI